MDDDELRALFEDEGTFSWIRALHRFLQSVFGEAVSRAEVVALMCLLLRFRITLRDGTIFNDETDINREIWTVDAATVAMLMCHQPNESASWWRGEYGVFPKDTKEFQELQKQMRHRIQSSPLVASCAQLW